ncbi:hypothetical protein KR093_004330 [Drosophila rubida]|uniref:Complex I-15 kDa n=1 Tax=Drosophila rubida TaxID=30044 RepID=A0AAD4K572_9MUSC|nr:hypothetical protein KR093_004330 [Drosophila rubida]
MSLSPFLRLPLTDLTGCLINHQSYDKCGEFEMKMMDCLEAYGFERGKQKCADLISDFQECVGMGKQLKRFHVSFANERLSFGFVFKFVCCLLQAMRNERYRQWLAGERKKEDLYADPPRVDAY